jgi:hypothetical protein
MNNGPLYSGSIGQKIVGLEGGSRAADEYAIERGNRQITKPYVIRPFSYRERTVRMLMKVSIPVGKGSQTIADGSLPRVIQETIGRLQPEAVYFLPENGRRTALFFFDQRDSSQLPAITEPLFMNLDAEIELTPVMNPDDLMRGLSDAGFAG